MNRSEQTISKTSIFPRIVLVGFMGAGKTSVAQSLAEQVEGDWVDLDAFIEAAEHKSVPEIILSSGEAVFRGLETKYLREALANRANSVVALGGGCWTIEENRKMIRESGFLSVWLDASFEVCWSRIENAENARPLAPNKLAAQTLFERRRDIYAGSDLRIAVQASDPLKTIAARILEQITTVPKKPRR